MNKITGMVLAVFGLLVDGINRLAFGHWHPALVQAGIANATKTLPEILKELKQIQDEHKGKAMPQEVGEKFDALAAEAKALQDSADRDKLIKGIEIFGAEVPDAGLPADRKNRLVNPDAQVVGYLRLGSAVTATEEFKRYLDAQCPANTHLTLLNLPNLHEPVIPLTAKQYQELRGKMEAKAVATIGADVIAPERIGEVVRATEQDQLRIRDVINVAQTTSNAIEWVKLESYTRAAAPVAEQAAKPEATAEVGIDNTTVRTVAVWMPVTEQQLQDIPQLQNIINVELLYDLRKVEEEQIMYGSGTGQNLPGILRAGSGVEAARTVVGDTVIDKIRRAITDVRRSGYSPNAVVIDPLDWEEVVLTKGSDEHYLYQVFPTADGTLRIWGLNVVETVAAEANAGNTTEERNIVVGDWIRGATLYDRMQAAIQIGWINDQFIKNMRTIRAEERLALALKRPAAFRKIATQAAVA